MQYMIGISMRQYVHIDIQEYNSNSRRQIASLTKMMTLFSTIKLCKKYQINMDKCYFRVTSNAAGTRGTSSELETRQWVTINDLLYAMMLPSGNDAALVLAQNLGACVYYDRIGQAQQLVDLKSLDLTDDSWNLKIYIQQFVKIMNIHSKQLGMKDTIYINPHGLDSSFRLQAYSNVQDQAILLKNIYQIQEGSRIIGRIYYSAELKTMSGKEVQIRKTQWYNTNILLKQKGFIGGKTGQTQFAGNCLASLYQSDNNQKYIIVILGSSTKQSRFTQTKQLVDRFLLNKKQK